MPLFQRRRPKNQKDLTRRYGPDVTPDVIWHQERGGGFPFIYDKQKDLLYIGDKGEIHGGMAEDPALDDFWNDTIDLSLLSEDQHTMTILANDTVNHLNYTQTVIFTVDRTAPTVNIETTNNSNYTSSGVMISFNFTDNIFARTNCTLYIDGVEIIAFPQPSAYDNVPLTIWFLSSAGAIYISVAHKKVIISFNVKYLL